MMQLSQILQPQEIIEIRGSLATNFREIHFDSRKVGKGDAFFALKGTSSDGHQFISKALENGAVAVICEAMPDEINVGCTYARVTDTHKILGLCASRFYGNPSQQLNLVGVTGTNGKTTTATLLHELFKKLGYASALISTIKNFINDQPVPSTHTTPDPVALNRFLRQAVDMGCQYAFMEVSSHAIEQQRIKGLEFAGGIFTNITHDHLDYHKTFENYLKAKKKFFDELPEHAFALTNADDRNGRIILQNTKARKYFYALKTLADFNCRILENSLEGLLLSIDNHEISCELIGYFNAYNLLAVYSTAILLGQEKESVLKYISTFRPVEGRFEYIISEKKILGIVDYAHTPDALENVLTTIGNISTGNNKVITVVGAGGDRDRSKRPIMARICANRSTNLILTSDNPRTEDPLAILEEMRAGLDPVQERKTIIIEDRRQAIKTACTMAQPGDIILVAGKGHEKYQEIKGVKYPFDDKEVLKNYLLGKDDIQITKSKE